MEYEMHLAQDHAVLTRYRGTDAFVEVPSAWLGLPVKRIREGAFAGNVHIRTVSIPKNLEFIGDGAFRQCERLQQISCAIPPEDRRADILPLFPPALSLLPGTLTSIGNLAFAGTALEAVRFEAKVLTLGERAFEQCESLKIVDMSQCTRLTMGKAAFHLSSLLHFNAPKLHLEFVPDYAFACCRELHTVTAAIAAVGFRSFYQCGSLKRIEMTKQILSAGRESFLGCERLEGVRVPQSAMKQPRTRRSRAPDPNPGEELAQFARQMMGQKLVNVLKRIEEQAAVREAEQLRSRKEEKYAKDTLLTLELETPGQTLVSLIKGTLEDDDGAYFLNVRFPSRLRDLRLCFTQDDNYDALEPLLSYAAHHGLQMGFLGDVQGDRLAAYHLMPLRQEASADLLPRTSKDIGADFLKLILERLLDRPVADIYPTPGPYTMIRQEDFDIFVEICGESLPKWVIQAYRRNRDIFMHSTGYVNEEKKHALTAQKMLLNIDWNPKKHHVPTVDEARQALDKAFYGTEEIKRQILGVLAQLRRCGSLPKWGILFCGPAGTGKTTYPRLIAELLDLPMVLMDMTTVKEDPESLFGSRRNYANARQGKLVNDMFVNRSASALLLANEVDKADGNTLLSILDRNGFEDNFLEETLHPDFFIIGTCNDLDKLSKPLLDRFLVIQLKAYTPQEKRIIWQNYSLPPILKRSRIAPGQLTFTQEAEDLILQYAKEPGARDLEKFSEVFVRDFCLRADEKGQDFRYTYTAQDVRALLKPPAPDRTSTVVNAACLLNGNAQLFTLEASVVPGFGSFRCLGPLGPKQRSYCEAAYWAARSATRSRLEACDVTVFVPQEIPDDEGNQIGFACYAAICAQLLSKPPAFDHQCFIGGCDLSGRIYFDGSSLTPILRAMEGTGLNTLYVPRDTACLADPAADPRGKRLILEASEARTLFTMAVTQSCLAGHSGNLHFL